MKKTIIIFFVIIIILLVSGQIENSYCHNWVTTPPAKIVPGSDPSGEAKYYEEYFPNNPVCRVNVFIALPGALLLAYLSHFI